MIRQALLIVIVFAGVNAIFFGGGSSCCQPSCCAPPPPPCPAPCPPPPPPCPPPCPPPPPPCPPPCPPPLPACPPPQPCAAPQPVYQPTYQVAPQPTYATAPQPACRPRYIIVRQVEQQVVQAPAGYASGPIQAPVPPVPIAPPALPPLPADESYNPSAPASETQEPGYRVFASKTLADPRCNSIELRTLLENEISGDPNESKRRVHKAANEQFQTADSERGIDVICANGSFSYRIATDIFCEHTKGDITCFAYQQHS